jgi:hypothetical protein
MVAMYRRIVAGFLPALTSCSMNARMVDTQGRPTCCECLPVNRLPLESTCRREYFQRYWVCQRKFSRNSAARCVNWRSCARADSFSAAIVTMFASTIAITPRPYPPHRGPSA